MNVEAVTPILNVSDIKASFVWFEKLGWKKGFEWGDPTGFGAVCSGKCEIFLCQGGQGGRGKGENKTTFGVARAEQQDRGAWMSIWVDDVDAVYRRCLEHELEITWEPENMAWDVREMHVRHPDGHVFRISQSTHQESVAT